MFTKELDELGLSENSGGLIKKSMRINDHRTSLALEEEFWAALKRIANARDTSLPKLLADIDAELGASELDRSLASAARVFALREFANAYKASDAGPANP